MWMRKWFQEIYITLVIHCTHIRRWRGNNLGQIITENGTFLKHVDAFDNLEFGVSAKDARAMAPSTRKILEHCFLALYDSGINYRGREIGCFTAGSTSEITSVTESVSHSRCFMYSVAYNGSVG